MSSVLTAAITALGLIIVAAGGWVVAARGRHEQTQVEMHAKGGTVRSTEAEQLWDEADKIREYLSKALVERDVQVTALRADVAEVSEQLVECKRTCELAREELLGCRRREAALEARLVAAGL